MTIRATAPRAPRKAATKTAKLPKPRSKLEETFALQLRVARLRPATREYRFHPTRRWRFDFAWPDLRMAVEIEGAVWTGGRHTRGSGFIEDADKYNAAALLGWRVLRFTGQDVKSGRILTMLEPLLRVPPASPGYI